MTAPFRAPSWRIAIALSAALGGAFFAGPARAAEEAPAPIALPPYLKGVDLNQPTQAAFKGWPPKELVERPYWLSWNAMTLRRVREPLHDRLRKVAVELAAEIRRRAVAWAIVTLVRHNAGQRSTDQPVPAAGSAQRILEERFARGEIDATEFQQRRDILRDTQ
jgi:hypothetical protein